MIEVEITKDDELIWRLDVKGHAGFAKAGKDIVCAGVSAIIFGLLNAVDEKKVDIEIQENEINLTVLKKDHKIADYLELTVIQLKTIAESYGQYLKIHERRTS